MALNNFKYYYFFQTQGSTGTSVLLDRVTFGAEGIFECVVTTLPEFTTKRGSKLIRVARIPNHWERPEVHFHGKKDKLRYQQGDTIDVECISRGGYPPPNITWYFNGQKVNLIPIILIILPFPLFSFLFCFKKSVVQTVRISDG